MDEIKLGNVEETLFVPMRGRVFASKNFPEVLYDKKALEIAEKLPKKYMDTSIETEYTLLASATRSKNIDAVIAEFIRKNPESCIINLGAGLETTFHRNSNGIAKWFELDLKEVTSLRKEIIGESDLDEIISYSIFDYQWIDYVKNSHDGPYLVIASGLFYYFPMDEILDLLNHLNGLNDCEVVFDCVSRFGMKFTKKYMKDLNKEDARMYFYLDEEGILEENIENVTVVDVNDFYANLDMSNMNLLTKISMKVSDILHMVKLIHLKYTSDEIIDTK